MVFFFRGSVGFGPLKINFSKSGIGASVGVRGARISAGPRGTYVSVGRNGFYYRQRIDIPAGRSAEPTSAEPPIEAEGQIHSAEVGQLVDSSSEELLKEINACASRFRAAPIFAFLTFLAALIYF